MARPARKDLDNSWLEDTNTSLLNFDLFSRISAVCTISGIAISKGMESLNAEIAYTAKIASAATALTWIVTTALSKLDNYIEGIGNVTETVKPKEENPLLPTLSMLERINQVDQET